MVLTVWDLWGQAKYVEGLLVNGFKKLIGKSELDFKDTWVPFKTPDGEVRVDRYVHAFTKREIKKLVKSAGFKIEHVKREIGYNIYLIAKK